MGAGWSRCKERGGRGWWLIVVSCRGSCRLQQRTWECPQHLPACWAGKPEPETAPSTLRTSEQQRPPGHATVHHPGAPRVPAYHAGGRLGSQLNPASGLLLPAACGVASCAALCRASVRRPGPSLPARLHQAGKAQPLPLLFIQPCAPVCGHMAPVFPGEQAHMEAARPAEGKGAAHTCDGHSTCTAPYQLRQRGELGPPSTRV